MIPERIERYDEIDALMRDDLEHYCAQLIKITTKEAGAPIPFLWKPAQRTLHKRIERILDKRGLVRVLVLKGRQLGCSTYVAARYYQRATLWIGNKAYILTHEDKATQNLFGMVKRIHAHMPSDYLLPTINANENELAFGDGMEAGYRVGTAKNVAGTGRSQTFQLFHGSEVAFWPHAESHFAGVLQAVGHVPGTEVILETTANGVGGVFYDQWILAESKQSDFEAIFLPWMLEPGYARALEKRYEPSLDEEEYQRLYKLTDMQLCWLHYKNIELGGEPGVICSLFRQEYPATAAEAFQASSGASLIADEHIRAARRKEMPPTKGVPRVLGVDIARSNKDVRDPKTGKVLKRDATRIIDRQGRRMGRVDEAYWSDDPVFLAAKIARHLRDNPDIRKAFIDVTEGMGAAVVSLLRSNSFEERVDGVNFGSTAQEPDKYPNRRCEIWARMRDWIKDPGGADIPDNDLAHRHLASAHFKYDANSRLVLEPKAEIKKRLGFSPDWGDAAALTFADILPADMSEDMPKWMREIEHLANDDDGGDWQTT